ncbi:hypothetical protein [Nocardia sp. XZ_19_231]|uniref:hypothetical protein n=1 Tax=Nocardia sp. XZ_19_231 TaxID=2769252 RepID=UPI00188EF727|nr:hypothetical protein [Nocardia sp. XZ_19_231]
MSERPVEDEIIDQARHFGRALMALASQHGRAVTWMEQRRIRKEVSRALRQQRQAEFIERQKQLINTERAVDRYRAHAQAVTMRSNDPRVDHDRRSRDQLALRTHATDIQQAVLTGHSLTPVEQGIVLDGIDSATAFPGHDPKRALFAGAHRVKGIDALRYRATVARTRAALPQQVAELTEQRRQANTARYQRPTQPVPVRKATGQEREAAIQQLRRAQLDWDLNAPTADQADLRAYDRQVRTATAGAAEVGVSPERIAYERAHAVENSKFTASVYSLRPGGDQAQVIQTVHPTGREAAEWTHRTVRSTNWVPQVALKAVIHERGVEAPARVADGTYEQVSARTAEWTPTRKRPTTTQETAEPATPVSSDADRLAEVEKQLKAMGQDRDRLMSKVSMLQRGMDSVTADRDEIRTKLDSAEGRIESLTNRNTRLAAEIDEVRRDQPDIEDLRAERDQYKTQRDRAIDRLAKQTAAARERPGGPERVAAETNQTQPMPSPITNGHNGIERSR